MIDFLMISTRSTKRGVIEIYPKFIIKKSSDLMIRGGDFYAIWLEDRGLWSTDEQDALQLIDWELDKYAEENRKNFDSSIKVLHMWDSESGMIDSWHKYCQKQMRDSFHMLDEKLIFSNTPTNKKDYASKRLNYPLEEGATDAWNKLMSTIYSEEERTKIEWAIGSIVCGESKKLQKFMVLYGAAGTGKSTVLNIVQQLFEGYYSVFDAKALGSSSNSFALDPNADLPFTMGLEDYDEFTQFDKNHRPIFPGYTFEGGKSVYRGEEVGEGGYVYSEPGMYSNIALLDIASMHPSSIVAEELFGPEYTKRFNEILQARIAIKHKDFDKAKKMLGGALAKYLTDENAAADLAQALKIAINSVYGLTSAGFENPFRDNRNKDNIVAKRGALFMVNLKHAVQSQGFTVAHIKTDSIKIPDATPEIIKFVTEYGKLYGYNFEHEATYDRMCLVNDAVYIARYATVEKCCDLYGKNYIDSAKDICKENKKHPYAWTATGTQFQIPYVFKTLFSKENIEFEDMCETKSVTSSLYLDMNEALPDVSVLEAERDKLWKQITDSKRMTEPMPTECERVEELTDEIAKGHDYHFIGKVGQFCPIKPGCGGGILLREAENKKTGEKGYAAATGSKGFRWLESEMVKQLDKQGDIDRGYYNNMVDEAVKSLSVYGDFERFAADEPYVSDNTPPWFGAGEPHEDDTTPFDVR